MSLLVSNCPPLSKIMARDAKSGDDVVLYKFTYLGGGYRCDDLGFDPLGEVVYSHKEVLALARSLWKRAVDVHSPRGEHKGTDYRCHSGGGGPLNGCELLALVVGPHQSHHVLPQTRPVVAGSYGRNGQCTASYVRVANAFM